MLDHVGELRDVAPPDAGEPVALAWIRGALAAWFVLVALAVVALLLDNLDLQLALDFGRYIAPARG